MDAADEPRGNRLDADGPTRSAARARVACAERRGGICGAAEGKKHRSLCDSFRDLGERSEPVATAKPSQHQPGVSELLYGSTPPTRLEDAKQPGLRRATERRSEERA